MAEREWNEGETPAGAGQMWRWAAAVAAVTVLVGAGVWMARRWHKDAPERLEKEVAAIVARGEPMEWKQFAGPPVPEEQNAVPLYRKAREDFEKGQAALPMRLTDSYDTLLRDLLGNPEFRRQHRAEAGALLEAARGPLALLRQGTARPGADWGIDFTGQALVPWPAIGESLSLARTAVLAGLEAHDASDDAEALRCFADAIALGRTIGTLPAQIFTMVEWACRNAAVNGVEQILPALRVGGAPAASAAKVRALAADFLDTDSLQKRWVRCLMAERCMIYDTARRLKTGKDFERTMKVELEDYQKNLGPEAVAADCALIVRAYTAAVDAAGRTSYPGAITEWTKSPDTFDKIRDQRLEDRDRFNRLHPAYGLLTMPLEGTSAANFRGAFTVFARSRMAGTALAMRLFELEKGRQADKLEDLVAAGYLPAVPDDPFREGAGTIRWNRGLDSRLYSVSEDGRDDGGKFKLSDTGAVVEGTPDLVFFLRGERPVGASRWKPPVATGPATRP